jgi:hypothetical protein
VKSLRTELSGLHWSNTDGLNIGVDEKDTWRVYSTVSGLQHCIYFSFAYLLLGSPESKTILKQGVPIV